MTIGDVTTWGALIIILLFKLTVGTTKIKNLDDNIGSLRVKLTEEDVKEISEAVPLNEVAGAKIYESMIHLSWKFANTPAKDSKVST